MALMVFYLVNWSGGSSGTWSKPFPGLLSVDEGPQFARPDAAPGRHWSRFHSANFACVERRQPRSFWLT